MEESYETFEEELGPPRADPPPQKPVRQIRRPEMHTTRRIREEMAPVPQQLRSEPKTLPREPSFPRTTSLHKALSIQNLSQIETPWENVTLNRCLFVAITILVLTSGFQRLNETLRGRAAAEEEEEGGLTVRRSGTLRHRGQPPEPETSLWEVLFWWLPDLDDEDDEEEDNDGGVRRRKPKRGAPARAASGLRNRPLPSKNLMKRREKEGKERRSRRGRKDKDEEIKDKKEQDKTEESIQVADDDDDDEEEEEVGEGNEEAVPKKNKNVVQKKEKKKTQKG